MLEHDFFRKPDLLRFAQKAPRSPLAGTKLDDVEFADGWIRRKDGTAEVSLADAMRAGKVDRIEKEASAKPNEKSRYSHYTHSAVFAEVKVDEELRVIRVTRVVSACARIGLRAMRAISPPPTRRLTSRASRAPSDRGRLSAAI